MTARCARNRSDHPGRCRLRTRLAPADGARLHGAIHRPDRARGTARPSAAPDSAPRTDCGIETGDSLAIRVALLREAIDLVPRAGPFGFGLDGFLKRDCLGMMPHNTILQALIEFGWIGGGALALLLTALALRLARLARKNSAAAFLACALAYAGALTMVHGRLSRQNDLLLLLGAGAGVVAGAARQRQSEGGKPCLKSPCGSSPLPLSPTR
jgi:hypothetical protein